MLAGFTQLPERNPFINPELKKPPTAVPVWPSSIFNNPAIPVVAVFDPGANGFVPVDDNGEASCCSELVIVDIVCDSDDCTPVPVDAPPDCAIVPA